MTTKRILTKSIAAFLLACTGTNDLHAQTSVTYIGPTAGNSSWTLGSNWTGGVAPDNGQPLPGSTYNATVNVGSVVSLPFTNINLNNFNLFGSTTSGTGTIYVDGQAVIGDGASLAHAQFYTNGGLTFQGSASISLDAFGNGNGTAPSTATWTSGTLSFIGSGVDVENSANATWNASAGLYDSASATNTFANNGTFNKETAAVLTIEPVFNQGSTGTLNVNAGELQLLGGGGSFTQGATNVLGTSTLTLGGSFNFTGPGSFSVASTATLNIVSGTTNVNFPYNHVGTATVASGGTLRLMGSGTHSGSFVPAAGGVVQIGSGTHVITPTATLGGAGSLNITGGTVQLDNGVALAGAASININGGTLTSPSTASLAHPLTRRWHADGDGAADLERRLDE